MISEILTNSLFIHFAFILFDVTPEFETKHSFLTTPRVKQPSRIVHVVDNLLLLLLGTTNTSNVLVEAGTNLAENENNTREQLRKASWEADSVQRGCGSRHVSSTASLPWFFFQCRVFRNAFRGALRLVSFMAQSFAQRAVCALPFSSPLHAVPSHER